MKATWIITLFITINSVIDAQQFITEPEQLDFKLEPGQWDKMYVKVTNQSDKKQCYNVVLKDFTYDQEGQIKYLNDEAALDSYSKRIKIIPDSFSLAPYESVDITVIMKVPKNENLLTPCMCVMVIQALINQYEIEWVDRTMKSEIGKNQSHEVYIYNSFSNEEQIRVEIDSIGIMPDEKSVSVDFRNIGKNIIKGEARVLVLQPEFEQEMRSEVKEITIYPSLSKTLIFHLPMQLKKGMNLISVSFDYSDDKELLKKVKKYEVK